MRVIVLMVVGLAITGCASKTKEPRVCTKEELHVKSLTKHQYQECIDGVTLSGEFIEPRKYIK